MKKYTRIIALLTVFLTLAGCGKQSLNTRVITSNEDYSIVTDGDGYYLVFDENSENANDITASEVAPTLSFKSIVEMKEKVLGGQLSEEEISILGQFAKNDADKIKVCDFNNLFDAVIPKNAAVKEVNWSGGERYVFDIDFADMEGNASLRVHTEESYQSVFETYHTGLSNNGNLHITEIEDRNATEYSYTTATAKCKTVSYVLHSNGFELLVDETYVLEINDDLKNLISTSETVPVDIRILGTNENGWFEVYLYSLTERPSVEWLSAFGLVKVN